MNTRATTVKKSIRSLIVGLSIPAMLLKHNGDRFWIYFLRLCEQAICLRIVTHSLFVKSPLSEATSFDRLVVFPPAIRHDTLPCSHPCR